MINIEKSKDWVRENAPMLSVIYENKYIGMLYDRFASLSPAKQKQVVVGGASGVICLVILHLLISYLGLWGVHRKIDESYEMIALLSQYQKQQKDQSADLRLIERNSALSAPGSLKAQLISTAKGAGISPRMVQVEESSEGSDIQMKRATAKLQKVNLAQLKSFLQGVEFGSYSLDVSSIKINNDEKVRGYMDVELGIVAYLFAAVGAEEQ